MKGVNNQGRVPNIYGAWPGWDGNRINDGKGRSLSTFRTGSSSPSSGERLFTCLTDVQDGYLWRQERAGLGFW